MLHGIFSESNQFFFREVRQTRDYRVRGSVSGLVKYQITASEGILSDRSQIRVHLIVMRGCEDRFLEVRSSEDDKLFCMFEVAA